MLTFLDVLDALSNVRPEGQERVISEAVIDSRQAVPRALFIALSGERVDGHDFVGNAFENGANFALVDKDLSAEYPLLDLRKPVPERRSSAWLRAPWAWVSSSWATSAALSDSWAFSWG